MMPFRVAGLASRFAAPPLCRSDPSTPRPTTTAGWKPGAIASSGLRTQKPGALRTHQVEPTSFTASFRPLNDGMDDPNGDGWARRHDLATYEIAAEEAFVDARYTNRARCVTLIASECVRLGSHGHSLPLLVTDYVPHQVFLGGGWSLASAPQRAHLDRLVRGWSSDAGCLLEATQVVGAT